MDNSAIWTTLTRVFRETFDDAQLTIGPETTAKDVAGWDSLTHIQLLVFIEKIFGVRFTTGEVAALANVGEMVELISRRVGQGKARV
jgi:acyl carrier protein